MDTGFAPSLQGLHARTRALRGLAALRHDARAGAPLCGGRNGSWLPRRSQRAAIGRSDLAIGRSDLNISPGVERFDQHWMTVARDNAGSCAVLWTSPPRSSALETSCEPSPPRRQVERSLFT